MGDAGSNFFSVSLVTAEPSFAVFRPNLVCSTLTLFLYAISAGHVCLLSSIIIFDWFTDSLIQVIGCLINIRRWAEK